MIDSKQYGTQELLLLIVCTGPRDWPANTTSLSNTYPFQRVGLIPTVAAKRPIVKKLSVIQGHGIPWRGA